MRLAYASRTEYVTNYITNYVTNYEQHDDEALSDAPCSAALEAGVVIATCQMCHERYICVTNWNNACASRTVYVTNYVTNYDAPCSAAFKEVSLRRLLKCVTNDIYASRTITIYMRHELFTIKTMSRTVMRLLARLHLKQVSR